jgi:hypothetical protein
MKGPVRYIDDLRLLPHEGAFQFRDYIPGVPGGKVKYWAQVGLIKRVGWTRVDCHGRYSLWELTDRARRLLG